jgi:hypothetical protein
MKLIAVDADPTLPWMQQLSMGNVPTGTPAIDQLLATYGMTLANYHVFPWGHAAAFSTEANVNIPALCALFAAQPGVNYAEPDGGCCDGNRITDSVYTDHVNLVYSYGWGDCPAGCTMRRFWEFNVFPDCSVEYVGSYGAALPLTASVCTSQLPTMRVFPNPAKDIVNIRLPDALSANATLDVVDVTGRVVMHRPIGPSTRSMQIPVEGWAVGVYGLRLDLGGSMRTARFVKQ